DSSRPFYLKSPWAMKKPLASLILLFMLAGGALAGVPLHFGESECSMGGGMMDMDCCKIALMQSETPDVAAARLCCAINCAHSGTTSPPNTLRVRLPSPARTATRPEIVPALSIVATHFKVNSRWQYPGGSSPTYLRNLALLI